MIKFFCSLAGLAILVAAPILVAIYGFGLQPKSWLWIIGGTFISVFVWAIFELYRADKS